jgi:hypothetical protein
VGERPSVLAASELALDGATAPGQAGSKRFERRAIGRAVGTGESFLLGFCGQGWVLAQPSEGRPVVGA